MQPPDAVPLSSTIHHAVTAALEAPPLSSNMEPPGASPTLSLATIAATTVVSSLVASLSTAATAAAAAAAATTAAVAAASPASSDDGSGECKLLGPFAILIQGALGALALTALVYKRWRERPQRPVKVWFFDVSKQVVGSVLLHLANLLMAMFSSGQIQDSLAKTAASTLQSDLADDGYTPNPCSFYLLNLAIDTTIGIPILIGILKILTVGASYTCLANPVESIESGHYGTPPKTTWWLKQCFVYFWGLIGMKTCVFIIFQLCPWLGRVGDWALRWTEGNEAVQIAFVMLIFPLIMNALQYYIIDTFIKQKRPAPEYRDPHDDAEHDHDHDEQAGLLAGDDAAAHGRAVDDEPAAKGGDTTPGSSVRVEAVDVDEPPDKVVDVDGSSRSGRSSSLLSHAEVEGVEQRPRV